MSRVAAIDCGTNSIRLLIAEVRPATGPAGAELVEVLRTMEVVRLGEGVDRTGRLAEAALTRTREALQRYTDSITEAGVQRIRMVATSATRDAENSGEFQAMVTEVLGQPADVVSGDEEARLSFGGGVRGVPGEGPYLVTDIGGGSTELVLGRVVSGVPEVDAACSVDIGCVRLTERHFRSDPPSAAEVAAAESDVRAAIALAAETVPVERAVSFVGLAGSVTTVAALALGLRRYDSTLIHHSRVSSQQVAEITQLLLETAREQRAAMPVIHPGRVDVIGAGALVLRVMMECVGATEVIVSEHDILDGIAFGIAAGLTGQG
jgi:exopolyphosphatase/guanosine-5'-triphosphate,3'-diphosphate pyrophosphatase